MRRPLNIILGVLEISVAVVLAAFVLQLPGTKEVMDNVGRVEAVGNQSSQQVAGLRKQLDQVRQRQPHARRLAAQLSQRVENLNVQQHDYDLASDQVANTLATTADSIDNATINLDGSRLDQLTASLAMAADLLDKRLAQAATMSGGRLEASARGLRGDVRRLTNLWDQAPPDVQLARSVSQVLSQFDDGLAAVSDRLADNRLQVLMLELKSMELGLLSAADTADRLGSMTNPLDAFSLRRDPKPKTIWPDGPQNAVRLRKLADGIKESQRELAVKAQMLPAIRAWIDASRASTADVRRDLGDVVQRRLADDPHLRNTPLHLASVAEDILAVGEDLGKLLRETTQLHDMANRLRQVRAGTVEAEKGLRQLRISLGDFAGLLRRLETGLRQGAFKNSLSQTLIVLTSFVEALPLLTDSLENELEEQDQALGRLQGSVEQVTLTLPEGGRAAARLIQMTRLLMSLMGAICLLHGAFLLVANLSIPLQYPLKPDA